MNGSGKHGGAVSFQFLVLNEFKNVVSHLPEMFAHSFQVASCKRPPQEIGPKWTFKDLGFFCSNSIKKGCFFVYFRVLDVPHHAVFMFSVLKNSNFLIESSPLSPISCDHKKLGNGFLHTF